MKLTLTNIKKMKTNSTPLQKRVINYIVDEWSNYDDKKHIFTDVLYHGCQSGVVGFLIWYSDTVRFYKQYKDEIDELSKIVIIFDKNSAIVPARSGVYRVRNRELENVTYNCFSAYAEFKCEIVHLFVTTFANNL